VIAGHAGIGTAAARQTLLALEKAGTATRVKGGRPGLASIKSSLGNTPPAFLRVGANGPYLSARHSALPDLES
jgi:hypothetical protein